MNTKAYIESGVIESYVLGIADAQEAAELEQLSRQYPEIRQAIDAFELAQEKTALAAASPAPAHVKTELFTALAGEFREEKQTAKLFHYHVLPDWRGMLLPLLLFYWWPVPRSMYISTDSSAPVQPLTRHC